MNNRTKKLVYISLFAALVLTGTLVLRIPVPSVNGYVNLGDMFILVCAYLFGGVPAMLAGAIGAALGDVIGGYAQWAPLTILIKGAEGLVAGLLLSVLKKHVKNRALSVGLGVAVMSAAALVMVAGYFFASWALYGRGAAVLAVTSDLVQAAIAVGVAAALIYVVRLPKILKTDALMQGNKPIDENGNDPETKSTSKNQIEDQNEPENQTIPENHTITENHAENDAFDANADVKLDADTDIDTRLDVNIDTDTDIDAGADADQDSDEG